MNIFTLAVLFVTLCLFASPAYAASQSCEQLAHLALPHTTISSAETVAAGAFTPPASATPWLVGDPAFYKHLPAFCRVSAVSKPTPDSDIKIEVWMPESDWNGKFRGQGNGGFAGEIDWSSLGLAVAQGYTSAATDTGHAGNGSEATWALGHPEKIIDFGYRAIHEMTIVGEATTKAFYGGAPKHAYFASCSNGGRQALMEAQRFPDDYDGILAGAPANYWTHLLTSALWDAQATTFDANSYIPSSKIPAIAQAVLAACDANDGIKDGILNDPRQCHFDPSTILCKGADSDSCLTEAQVIALKKLYRGATDSKGKAIFPGFMPGGEEGQGGWPLWITGPVPAKALLFAFDYGYFADMVYDDAGWDYKKANLDEALATSDRKFANVLNSNDPNLKPFHARGGKLIVYHGWSDAAISPLNSINYYESVIQQMGKPDADSFLRLYMVPGMQHCAGGPGPDVFGENGLSVSNDPQHNMYVALEQWVEKGTAPPALIASKLEGRGPDAKAKLSRPLCPYPQEARYKGSGDPNEASNFTCETPK
ncbi:MAG TPA: tannase/feruloyl esterase family alpha/beta hydrolase [Candidatus Cybelea sp.]|nr:tannase/feruloyl esterase family alpha/beta hydrolase [Candidatus Cybelea sp.]